MRALAILGFLAELKDMFSSGKDVTLEVLLAEIKFMESYNAANDFLLEELENNVPEAKAYLAERNGE